MSYGKPELPSHLTGFRAGSQTQQEHRTTFASKRIPLYIGEFRPTEESNTIRIVRAFYENEMVDRTGAIVTKTLPWFNYAVHTVKEVSKRTGKPYDKVVSICSAGPHFRDAKRRRPCKGCDLLDEQYRAGVKPKEGKHNRRSYSAVTVLHLGLFVKQPDMNPDGSVKMGENGNAYWRWHQADEALWNGTPEDERTDAIRLHWSMGSQALTVLEEREGLISMSCSSCGTKGVKMARQFHGIRSELWVCQKCGDSMIDVAATELKASEIEQMVRSPMRCGSCSHTEYPQELVSCTACNNPVRATMFDVDLQLKMVRPADGGFPTLVIEDHSAPYALDERMSKLAQPLDLATKVFRPYTEAEQAEVFGPFLRPQSPPTMGSRAYTQKR